MFCEWDALLLVLVRPEGSSLLRRNVSMRRLHRIEKGHIQPVQGLDSMIAFRRGLPLLDLNELSWIPDMGWNWDSF